MHTEGDCESVEQNAGEMPRSLILSSAIENDNGGDYGLHSPSAVLSSLEWEDAFICFFFFFF